MPIREGVVAKNYLLRMIHVVALTFFSYWYSIQCASTVTVRGEDRMTRGATAGYKHLVTVFVTAPLEIGASSDLAWPVSRVNPNWLAEAGHCFDCDFQVVGGRVGIAPDQSGCAVPKQGGNGALSLAAHSQPTGEGMPQDVPGDSIQLEGLYCLNKDARAEVPLIQQCGWVFG